MKKLEHIGVSRQTDEDIEDAEFTELTGQASAAPIQPQTLTKQFGGCFGLVLKVVGAIALSLIALFLALAIFVPLDEPAANENQSASTVSTEIVAAAENASQSAARKISIPTFPKGEIYADVRQELLRLGYEPAPYSERSCEPYGTTPGEECHDRPEVYHCSGTGMGFCNAYWVKGSAVFGVTTSEGPDGSFHDGFPMKRIDLENVLRQDGVYLVK